ncbi:hypothetical protein AQJ43_36625 [Streptomyces avermitilis]|nr:hypothetical protein AQJ43_36625 [Streptomyces avermitilis]
MNASTEAKVWVGRTVEAQFVGIAEHFLIPVSRSHHRDNDIAFMDLVARRQTNLPDNSSAHCLNGAAVTDELIDSCCVDRHGFRLSQQAMPKQGVGDVSQGAAG